MRFNADVSDLLPWTFRQAQNELVIMPGETVSSSGVLILVVVLEFFLLRPSCTMITHNLTLLPNTNNM